MKKEPKHITVKLVLAWVFSILFILGGVGSLVNSVLGGMLMVLAGIIIFPPFGKMLEEKSKIKLSGWLKVFIVLILLVFSSSLMISEERSAATEKGSLEIPLTEETEGISAYKFGDKVIVGDFAYTFHSMKTKSEIGEYIFDSFYGEEADGIFLIFDVTIENIGKESRTMWGSYVNIIDDQERVFEHDYTAEIYLDNSFSFEQMQPSLPKRGKIVFDVPQNIKGMIEISSDSLWSDEKKYVSWV